MTEIISAAAPLDDLTAQIKLKIVENHVLSNAFNRNINQNSVDIGQWLSQAKKLVNHGQWQIWLADNFQMTVRTAQNYMKVAAYFGVNSTFKNENVFAFQPAALIELTKMTPAELQNFITENPAAEKLSVRNLREKIRQFKNPALTNKDTPSKIENDENAKKECVMLHQFLTLPAAPSFSQVPAVLIDAAKKAGVEISINFSRALKPSDTDILVTRINSAAIDFYSTVADFVIFAAPLEFVRSDDSVKKIRPAIWYFGNFAQIFYQHFSNFGNLFLPAKKPAEMTGNSNNLINNCGQIIPFHGVISNG